MVLLKYLINFWRTLEMTLVNCEINVTGTVAHKEPKFATTDTKLYVPVVTLLT